MRRRMTARQEGKLAERCFFCLYGGGLACWRVLFDARDSDILFWIRFWEL